MSVPKQELELYRESFQQARNAGNLLLDQISPFATQYLQHRQTGRSLKDCQIDAAGLPKCFDPVLALERKNREEHPSIAVRRLALETIAAYNDLLLDVAEGKPVTAAVGKIEELRTLLEAVVQVAAIASPLPGAVDGAIKLAADTLLNDLKGPISAAMMRSALARGHPAVKRLLAALAAETGTMYDIYKEGRSIDLLRAKGRLRSAQLAGGGAAAAEAEVATILADIVSFHDKLGVYVVVLDKTDKALDALIVAAMSADFSIGGAAAAIRKAAELRDRSEEFWKLARGNP